ncbi:MAG: ABC transporter substrate-binding protein [Oscillospiraceae bacterium]|jgi:putative ABC transport system substrate-binding protein|nr:ABC transporter substrate-binding protein [Oscillospiraceae bacterium]
MKQTMNRISSRKLFALILCAALALASQAAFAADVPTVGIIQFAPHPSLDNCTAGFLLGLEEGGYVEGETVRIDFQNAMGDMATSDMQAKNMAAQGVALLTGVATPAAMSAYAATKEAGTPNVFVAVSDAVAAGIVLTNEAPGTNATGVSDVLNLEKQLELIRAFLPDAKTIGILYTTSEPNSITHLNQLRELAPSFGFEVDALGVSGPSEVAAAAAVLAPRVDLINNFVDNNVVDNLSQVLRAADEAGIPVFGSEVEQVVNGCLATQGIDYIEVGRAAGLIAADILRGNASPETTPVLLVNDVTPAYNSQVAERLGLVLPDAYADALDVTAESSAE